MAKHPLALKYIKLPIYSSKFYCDSHWKFYHHRASILSLPIPMLHWLLVTISYPQNQSSTRVHCSRICRIRVLVSSV